MEKRTYIGIIHKDDGSNFGVSFHDFPGCTSAGKTLDEAKKNAIEALQGHIDVMVEGGDLISDPSPISEITADETGIAFVTVDVMVPEGAVKRINITARASDLAVIDSYLRKSGRNRDRSVFLVTSALERIQSEKSGGELLVSYEDPDEEVGAPGGRTRSDARVRDVVGKRKPRVFERFTTKKADDKKTEKRPA